MGFNRITFWLFNIAMENQTPICKFDKPSISIRAIYTMAMLVITRGYILTMPRVRSMENPMDRFGRAFQAGFN